MKRMLSLIGCFALLINSVGCAESKLQSEEESIVEIILEKDEALENEEFIIEISENNIFINMILTIYITFL